MTVTAADSLQDDAAAFGIDPATLPARAVSGAERGAPDGELIYPENWPALNVFLALSNAWTLHLPALGGKPLWRGIPRTEIESTLRLLGLWRERADLLPRLWVLEAAALERLNADA